MKQESFGLRLFEVVLGLAICGAAFYMIVKADIGLSPWDAFAMSISYYIPITYGQSVQLVGVVVLIADLVMGGPIGVGTFVFAFVTGPASQVVFDLFRFEPRDVEHEGLLQTLGRLKKQAKV